MDLLSSNAYVIVCARVGEWVCAKQIFQSVNLAVIMNENVLIFAILINTIQNGISLLSDSTAHELFSLILLVRTRIRTTLDIRG